MTKSAYEDMSGPDLVSHYNMLVERLDSKDFKTVKRFATHAAGIARCKKIEAALNEAIKAGKQEESQQAPNQLEEQEDTEPDDKEVEQLLEKFKARKGTFREKLLRILIKHRGTSLDEGQLARDVYGPNPSNPKAIQMVIKGVPGMIKKNDIKMELRKSRNGKNISHGLYQTDGN